MLKNISNTIILIFLIFMTVEVLTYIGWTSNLERLHYDLWHTISGKRIEKTNVVIAAIDDKTLFGLRDEPLAFWGPHFGEAIIALKKNGAKTIGLDFLFSVSAESWLKKIGEPGSSISRTYDIPFRTELSSGNVVLSSIIATNDKGENERLMPPFDYWAVMPGMRSDIGIGNLNQDEDGVIRSFIPNFGINSDPTVSFPALLAAKSANINPAKSDWLSKNKKIPNKPKTMPIGFVGPPGTIPRVSFIDLISKNESTHPVFSIIKDKIIIIAEENTGTQDIHHTPYSRSFPGTTANVMTGPEIHANVVETVISGKFPEPVNDKIRTLAQLLVIILSIFLFLRLRPIASLFSVFGICIITAGLSYVLFLNYITLPTAGIEYGTAMSYLGSLAIKYTGEEKKRAKLRKIFGKYVSDEIVEKLASSEEFPDLGGELVEITVLFSDIRNFTTISENLSPREVVEMINKYLGMACEPILENGGTIDKFIGDAIMAIFGAPAVHDDHAERAIKAALRLKDMASEYDDWLKKRFPDKNLPEFKIGVGIHTGKALVGNIGSSKRMEYTAMGDVVNTASRLEGLSKTLGWVIVASHESIQAVNLSRKASGIEADLVFGSSKTVKVKGREQDVAVSEIITI